jgi:predicted nucleic acid-binding protein
VKKWSLDASFMIDFLEGKEYAARALREGNYRELVAPSLSKAEVKWSEKDIRDFEKLKVTEFGAEQVSECIKMKDFLQQRSEMINKVDIMIAAQSSTSDSILITADEDFKNLEECPGFDHINLADERET